MQLATRFRSTAMRAMASETLQQLQRVPPRLARRLSGRRPRIHYFHEFSDPFSQLAAQRLPQLAERYDVELVAHAVSRAADAFRGDASRFDEWAMQDACSVAPFHNVEPPPDSHAGALALARSIPQLAPLAAAVASQGDAAFAAGNALRRRLGHYQGAMFHYEGEWFWGLDRLGLLESRLVDEGHSRAPELPPIAPRPVIPIPAGIDASGVCLEVFPSLRSPYTAVGFPELLKLIDRTGVAVEWRPVMPMMMRGVPAPRSKQRYVMSDSGREGRAAGAPFGRIVDPFGEPVERALSLWSWVRSEQRERGFLVEYLNAAWRDGVDVASPAGLDTVLARAGLDPGAAAEHYGSAAAHALLDANLEAMLAAGLWGVPSFRVSGGAADAPPFACWGQDRIWRVTAEIVARAGAGA